VTIETPGPIRVAGEGVAIGGYDTNNGWYVADIFAKGFEYGGHENYYAHFKGKETASYSCGRSESIDLKEISLGAELPFIGGVGAGAGIYQLANGEFGIFFFAGGGEVLNHASLGFGFSF